jgi:hypothetical protein
MLIAGTPSIAAPNLSRLGLVQLGVSKDVELACMALLSKESGGRLPGAMIDSYKQRLAGATKLAILKDPDGIPCLLTATIFDESATIRRTCAVALGYATGNDSVVNQFLCRLDPATGETEAVVRTSILGTLRKIITLDNAYSIRLRAAIGLLEAATNDPDESVRKLAEEIAIDLGSKGILPPIPTENGNGKENGNGTQKKHSSGLSTAAKVGIGLGIFGALGAIIAVAMVKD